MGAIEGAVGDLEALVKDGLMDMAEGELFMDDLTLLARQMAAVSIDDSIGNGGDVDKIDEAQQALADGDDLRSSGDYKDAVAKFKDAVAKAEGALP